MSEITFPRRLSNLPELGRLPFRSFDQGDASSPLELSLLNVAYSYSARSLGANKDHLQSIGLIRGDLVFDIISDSSLNAFATTIDDHDVILMTSGYVMTLFFLFSRFVQLPESFPWVPGSSESAHEPAPLTSLPHSVNRWLELTAHDIQSGGAPAAILPDGESRREFVIRLWKWALLFTLCHELGHLVHGHVDHATSMADGYFSEIRQAGQRGGSWFERRRSQELQADRFAFTISFLGLMSTAKGQPAYMNAIGDNGVNRIPYTWAFALSTIFTLLAFIEGTVVLDKASRTHPNPFERLSGCALNASILLKEFAGQDNSKLVLETMGAWHDLDGLMGRTFGRMFAEFFVPEGATVPVNLGFLARQYAGHETWNSFDRIAKNRDAGKLRFQIFG